MTNQPWKKLVFQVLTDAPAELNKRLLNGREHTAKPVIRQEQIALESLSQLDEDCTTAKLLAWLRHAGGQDRQNMADYLSNQVSIQADKSPAIGSTAAQAAPSNTSPDSPKSFVRAGRQHWPLQTTNWSADVPRGAAPMRSLEL